MPTIALTHGSTQSPACWDRVRPLLEAKGHTTIAVDLPQENLTASELARREVHVQFDDFVAKDDPTARNLAPLDDAVVGAVVHSCDESDALKGQRDEPEKIVVAQSKMLAQRSITVESSESNAFLNFSRRFGAISRHRSSRT